MKTVKTNNLFYLLVLYDFPTLSVALTQSLFIPTEDAKL